MKYVSALHTKLIYVFAIPDELHRGCLKIGETTIEEAAFDDLRANSSVLNKAARKRIDSYTKTAGIPYELLYTEPSFSIQGASVVGFNDKAVHEVLRRSGIQNADFGIENQGCEWFRTDLETVKKAIQAAKEGKEALDGSQITTKLTPVILRPEQREAVDKTKKRFLSGNKMLWNAKMRFGKTVCALQVAKEMNFKRTLILTHRPVVDKGWFEDFDKVFLDCPAFHYGSKNNGHSFASLESNANYDPNYRYVYFASMQDLRGSEIAGGKFDKNAGVFSAKWDFVIIDEAHEGTQTELGQNVIKAVTKKQTYTLNLSGTPFNILDDYEEEEVYTWSYIDEQEAKQRWDLEHCGDINPYADLPRMNMFTFNLGELMAKYADMEEMAFNFKEFFRTWEGNIEKDGEPIPYGKKLGDFVHENDVIRFLDLIVKRDDETNYPFSTDEYRQNFRHSLWMIPGVKAAKALSELLKRHPIFEHFNIANVAGEGDDDVANDEAIKIVEEAIGKDPEQTYSITLSCGRLTTGVTVRPWTAVFMLSGSHSTDAKAYMQTIFRVQSPYTTRDGKVKEECFVFDFAPDRALKCISEAMKVSAKAGQTSEHERQQLGRFMNFCPIIGFNGTQMERFDVNKMLSTLKNAYVERVVSRGFEDNYLYNDKLLQLGELEMAFFEKLKGIIGSTKANHSTEEIDINAQGFSKEEYQQVKKAQKKKKTELTEEEKRLLAELKLKRDNRNKVISILRGISIRIPLLVYGAELEKDESVTLDTFPKLVDDLSWEEFMPRGITKSDFKAISQYYDEDVFRSACCKILSLAKDADKLPPMQRVKKIASIFSYFKNPDKETVLTPWRVVNMHMSDCIGGYDFWDENHTQLIDEPRFVDRGEVTRNVFAKPDTRILEINSKTGLYPLYIAFSTYMEQRKAYVASNLFVDKLDLQQELRIWDDMLKNNIFVVCKTPMAKQITKRTLAGYRDVKVNTRHFKDLINQIINKPTNFIQKMHQGHSYWKAINDDNMQFNAIVGNPPYQEVKATNSNATNSAFASAIYPYFIDISMCIKPAYISMITPSRWMTKQGQGISDDWANKMIKGNKFLSIHDYPNATDCFPSVEIKGGINYFLLKPDYSGRCAFTTHVQGLETTNYDFLDPIGSGIVVRDLNAKTIINKVIAVEGDYFNENSFSSLVSPKHYFDRNELLNSNWKDYSKVKTEENCIKYYLNKTLEACGYGWIKLSDIPKGTDTISLHKLYIPMAGGTGNDSQILGIPFYGEPNSVCSYTYLVIGYDKDKHNFNEQECLNILLYIKTKFFRYMVSIKKKTQNTTRELFQFVPLQDFSKPWTDEELYKKYNLTDEEIAYIESMIKPME